MNEKFSVLKTSNHDNEKEASGIQEQTQVSKLHSDHLPPVPGQKEGPKPQNPKILGIRLRGASYLVWRVSQWLGTVLQGHDFAF